MPDNRFTETIMDLQRYGIINLEGDVVITPKDANATIYTAEKIDSHLSGLFREVRNGKTIHYTPKKVCEEFVEDVSKKEEMDELAAERIVIGALKIRTCWETPRLRTVKGRFNYIVVDKIMERYPFPIDLLETYRKIEIVTLQPGYV